MLLIAISSNVVNFKNNKSEQKNIISISIYKNRNPSTPKVSIMYQATSNAKNLDVVEKFLRRMFKLRRF